MVEASLESLSDKESELALDFIRIHGEHVLAEALDHGGGWSLQLGLRRIEIGAPALVDVRVWVGV